MKLKFRSDHLSIVHFDEVELEYFTVLTGVNGSGKSHLLEAIENKKVIIEGNENSKVIRFNFETFKLENEGEFNGQNISQEKNSAWNYYESQIKPQAQNWKNIFGDQYDVIRDRHKSTKTPIMSIDDKGPISQYKVTVNSFYQHPHIRDNNQAHEIFSIMQKIPYTIDEISKRDFDKLYKPFSFKNDFLPMAIGKII